MTEFDFIASLRGMASHPAARALMDDAAVLEFGGSKLVLTHDMIVEGVHFLPSDPPEDVAWKLVAVNLSDLAAKGARPIGMLIGYSLGGEAGWDAGFVEGLSRAAETLNVPLLGGDTVSLPEGAVRSLGLTGIGAAGGRVPSRSGAEAGDMLWVTGTIGDAGAGLRIAKGELGADDHLLRRYRRPEPRLMTGLRLAPLATAMMDISDGLLIDGSRLAAASGIGVSIDLDAVPLSMAFQDAFGGSQHARTFAATAGDDYELLFTAPQALASDIAAIAQDLDLPITCIGGVSAGDGLSLVNGGQLVALPARLGYEHGSRSS